MRRTGTSYHYRDDPAWAPGDARYRATAPPEVTAGGAERSARREKRIDEFEVALASLGETDPWRVTRAAAIAAGAIVGVHAKTAMGYRTALRQRQPESAP